MTSFTDTSTIRLLPTRLVWIRLNRLLAWALLASPLVQLICHVKLASAMPINLGLVLVHGMLSLALFGAPKLKGYGFVFVMHVMGGHPADLSARNRFLLGGYRVALGMTPMLAMLPGVPVYVLLPFLYPIARIPVSLLQHIRDAVQYALQRWGYAEAPAGAVVFLYLLFSASNVIHAVF